MGVDAMRWTFARHQPGENNINFGFGTADEVRRRFIIPLWNVYSFFVTYANIDRFDPASIEAAARSRTAPTWTGGFSRSCTSLIGRRHPKPGERFEPDGCRAGVAEEFVESLSNWYVRRSRRRFWKSGLLGRRRTPLPQAPPKTTSTDKLSAYATLYEVLANADQAARARSFRS